MPDGQAESMGSSIMHDGVAVLQVPEEGRERSSSIGGRSTDGVQDIEQPAHLLAPVPRKHSYQHLQETHDEDDEDEAPMQMMDGYSGDPGAHQRTFYPSYAGATASWPYPGGQASGYHGPAVASGSSRLDEYAMSAESSSSTSYSQRHARPQLPHAFSSSSLPFKYSSMGPHATQSLPASPYDDRDGRERATSHYFRPRENSDGVLSASPASYQPYMPHYVPPYPPSQQGDRSPKISSLSPPTLFHPYRPSAGQSSSRSSSGMVDGSHSPVGAFSSPESATSPLPSFPLSLDATASGSYVPSSSHGSTSAGGMNTDDRPFKCPSCTFSFHRNHDLKRHQKIHLAVKPYPCKYCEKRFTRKDARARHMMVARHEEGVTPLYEPHRADVLAEERAGQPSSAGPLQRSKSVGSIGRSTVPSSSSSRTRLPSFTLPSDNMPRHSSDPSTHTIAGLSYGEPPPYAIRLQPVNLSSSAVFPAYTSMTAPSMPSSGYPPAGYEYMEDDSGLPHHMVNDTWHPSRQQ